MTSCPYCGQPATTVILSNPDRVCLAHALEFWTGLLVFATDRSEPCVKSERLCTCRSCQERSASYLHAAAVAATPQSPGDHVRATMRLAS